MGEKPCEQIAIFYLHEAAPALSSTYELNQLDLIKSIRSLPKPEIYHL